MNSAAGTVQPGEQAQVQLQATLRFAVAVTAAFVMCEFLQWTPSFLAPVLAGALLGNLPMRLPLKLGVVLVVTMAVASVFAFMLASLLRGIPVVLFGVLGVCIFLAFYAIARGRPAFPLLLLLICLAIVPVMVMVAPAHAGAVPKGLTRGILVAVVIIWMVYIPWPQPPPPKGMAAAAPGPETPEGLALVSTAVLLPLVLVYLLFGLSDVLPVLMGTLMLVVNFDRHSSRLQALGMILGNFAGGLFGLALFVALLTTPSLPFMALLLFPTMLVFGQRIFAGGPQASAVLIACNATLIIFGSAIASGPGPLSLWLTRVFQFALAGAFAVGMMSLLWHRASPRRPLRPPSQDHRTGASTAGPG